MTNQKSTSPFLDANKYSIRLRSGVYQLRKRVPNGKRIELSLCTSNEPLARERATAYLRRVAAADFDAQWVAFVESGAAPRGWLRVMLANVRHRAKKKGGAMSLDDLKEIAIRSGGRCEVSNLPFYFGTEKRNPLSVSVDRIDSSRGYALDNVRMTCLCVNYAMSHWGDSTFRRVAFGMAAAEIAKLSQMGQKLGSEKTGG